MKLLIAVVALLVVSASTAGFVLSNGVEKDHDGQIVRLKDVDTDGGLHALPKDPIIRQRRLLICGFFCGMISHGHNNSTCSLKCTLLGRGNGRFNGKDCVCEKRK